MHPIKASSGLYDAHRVCDKVPAASVSQPVSASQVLEAALVAAFHSKPHPLPEKRLAPGATPAAHAAVGTGTGIKAAAAAAGGGAAAGGETGEPAGAATAAGAAGRGGGGAAARIGAGTGEPAAGAAAAAGAEVAGTAAAAAGKAGVGCPAATAAAVVNLFDFSQLKYQERDLLVDAIHAYRTKVRSDFSYVSGVGL